MSIFLILSNESSSTVPLRNRNKLSKVFAHSVSFSLNLTTKSSIMNRQYFRGPAAKPRSHFSSVGRAVSIVAGKAARACYTTVSSQHSPSAALTYTHVQDTRARYKAGCQLKKKKDRSSVLDVIVVASISSNTKETGKHVGESGQTSRRDHRWHMQHATTIQFGALHQRHVTISRLRGTCSVWRTPHNAYMPPLRPSRNVVQLPHGQLYTSVNRKPVEEVDSGTSKEDGPRLQIGAYFLRSFVFGFVGFVRFLRRYRSRYLV